MIYVCTHVVPYRMRACMHACLRHVVQDVERRATTMRVMSTTSHRSRSGPQKKSGVQACMQSGCGSPQRDRFPARHIALPPWSSSPRSYRPGRVQGCCFPLSTSIRPLRSCLALEPRPNKMKRPPSKGPRSGPGRCPRNTTSSTAG